MVMPEIGQRVSILVRSNGPSEAVEIMGWFAHHDAVHVFIARSSIIDGAGDEHHRDEQAVSKDKIVDFTCLELGERLDIPL